MKYLAILKYVLLAISALTMVPIFLDLTSVDLMLRWAYVLLGAAVAAAVLFPLFNIAQNPKGAARSLVGVAIVAIVLGISYALGSAEAVVTPGATYTDPTVLKLSDTGLFTMYAAMTVTIAAIVIGEIGNIFK